MPLPTDTPCTSCGRRIWLHRLSHQKAWCAPKVPSPNLEAPEVLQAQLSLGQKVPFTLVKAARLVEEMRGAPVMEQPPLRKDMSQ